MNYQKAAIHLPKETKSQNILSHNLSKIKRLPSANCLVIRKEGTRKVFAVNPVDKYAPRKTGVFNVHLVEEEKDKSLDNPKRVN